MMFGRRSLASLLVCVALLPARSAHADPSAAEISSAKRAFESALSLESAAHWPEAELKLREAVAVKDTPGLRFHLAHCQAEQGHLLEAASEYDRASELLRQGAKAADVQKLLGPAAETLNRRIPQVALEIPSEVSAPVASVDGKIYPPSELELGLPLNPGRHELRVSAAGRRSFERSLQLKEGERVSIRAELAVATATRSAVPGSASSVPPAVAQERTAAPVRATSPAAVKLYLVIGESLLTAAGLAVGIGYRSAASSASDRVATAQARIDQAAPGDGSACESRPDLAGACTDLLTGISDHDRATRLSNVGFITAGVGAAALVTTWFAYPSAPRQASRFTLQPMAGFGRLGLLGRF